MAKEIGLKIKITSQGQEKVISNINDLETELQNLQTTLKTLDFGSEQYKQASKDIGILKSALRDIDKEIEGVDREQAFQSFSLAINGVTGAFLIATSAARTFGAESETIEEVQRAEQAALEAVNIALGVQAVAETIANAGKIKSTALRIKDTIATNAASVAQGAYNVVVGTSTGLLKAFRIALASTGIGLFVLGLVELISFLNDYIDEQQQANNISKEFGETSKKVAQDVGDEIAEIEILTDTIKDQTLSEKQRQKALDDLQKKYPNYFKNLKKDIDDTKTLDEQKKKLINTLIREAQNRAATDKITEATTTALNKKLDEENKLKQRQNELNTKLTATQDKLARAQAGTYTAFGLTQQETINFLKEDEAFFQNQALVAKQTYEKESKRIDRELETSIKSYTKAIKVNTEAIDANGGATTLNTDEKKDNNKQTEEAIKLQKEYEEALRDSIDAFGKINFDNNASVKILERANDIIQKQTELLNKRNETLKTSTQETQEFNKELDTLVGGLIIPDRVAFELKDTFLEIFQTTTEQIENTNIKTAEAQQNILKEKIKELGVDKIRKEIGDESLDTLLEFFETSVDITEEIDNYNRKLKGADKEIENIKNSNIDINKLVKEIADLENNRLTNLKTEEETNFAIKELVSERLFNTDEIFNLTDNQKEILDSITKTLIQQSKLYTGIFDVNKELEELTKKIDNNIKEQQKNLSDTSGLEKFIRDNQERIDEIDRFFKNLKAENSNLTEEQIKDIQKLIDSIKLDKKTNDFVEGLEDITNIILEVFNELSGRISSIFQRNNQILFEQLAQAEEQTLAIVGDATEKEREEQLKIQREFAKKRFDLEKKARIQELQFTLANSVAAGAQAVVQALGLPAPPPIPQLYAATIAGLTGIELLTIRDQIRTAQSSVFVGRRGGLIKGGNTHEQGGVPSILEQGEFVMSRPAVDRFGSIVSELNQSVGGRGLSVDDKLITQAISSQNASKAPIKTYVLLQDIRDNEKLNKRIEKLSRL
jgi:hypothetical protein